MTLLSVEASPTLRLISKAAEVDPGGTHELLRLALYEALCDQVDAARPMLERDLDAYVTKCDDLMRRVAVRKFIDARLAGEDVTAEEFSKVGPSNDNDRKHGWFRDLVGRFASHSSDVASAADDATRALQAASQKYAEPSTPFDKPRYANMRATGAALSHLGNENVKLVGTAATAVGSLGPEAEKVLGNGLRRTAYRYRGTEKRPSKLLKDDIKSGLAAIGGGEAAAAVLRADSDAEIRGRAVAGRPFDKDRSSVRAPAGVSPSVAVATYYGNRRNRMSEDQLEMNVAGDLASYYYLNKLPSPEHTAISIAAGAVPPSQGVIIDADGDVVSEAMGYGGDHYVPFDLKNLRSLVGGQYVRTRAVGGPTTEDIYTGLLSGARQVQVVSNSGVFTLEFDPSVRGGRRYSDKARQMVTRYQSILDAIDRSDKSDLYQVDITPKERRDIQQRYASDYTGDDLNTLVQRDIDKLRTQKSFKMKTDEEIDAEARGLLKEEQNPPRGRLQELRNEVRDKSRAESVKRFQLDGDGYEAAMKALQQEFPYFIRSARRERLPDFLNARGLQGVARFSSATDQGYVSPRTSHTGLARSITEEEKDGTVHRRGHYDAAGRRSERAAAPDATGDTTGTPDASGAAPKVKITDPLKIPAVNRRVGSYAANLKLVANAQGFRPGEQAVLVPEEWPSQPAGRVLFEANLAGSAHKEGMGGYLAELSPEGRKAYADALRDVPDMLDQLIPAISPRDKETLAESASRLVDLIDLSLPLESGHPETYNPDRTGRPLHFSDMPTAMAGTEEIEAYIKHLRVQEPPTLDYLDAFQDDADAVSTITALLDQFEQAKDAHAKAQSKVNLIGAQRAFALRRIRHQAATLEAITGSPGKAPASPEKEADLHKRQPKPLTWHMPGSPVATEFQKFLARR